MWGVLISLYPVLQRRKEWSMEDLEISGQTVDEAIQKALDKLGVTRDQVDVTILSEGRSGILGLGAEEARIMARPLVPTDDNRTDITETARGVLDRLLAVMGVEASVVLQERPLLGVEEGAMAPIVFDIKGDDLGILIGRRGQTLSCLQYIVRLIVAHEKKAWLPIVIDVEGYKQHRYEALRALARRIAEQVRLSGRPFTLEPMPAYERRIIHLTLADNPDVTTESTGEDEARKVVVQPKKN
jgi:spoIIIJ-associated protein